MWTLPSDPRQSLEAATYFLRLQINPFLASSSFRIDDFLFDMTTIVSFLKLNRVSRIFGMRYRTLLPSEPTQPRKKKEKKTCADITSKICKIPENKPLHV